MSEGIGARKKPAKKSYFEGLRYAFVTTSTDNLSQGTHDVEIERAYKKLYVTTLQVDTLLTSRRTAVSFEET